MINKDSFVFLINSGQISPNTIALTITLENSGAFGVIEYTSSSYTIAHIKNETNFKIIISTISFEGTDFQNFSFEDLTAYELQSGQEAIAYITFTPNLNQDTFNKTYNAKIQVIQTNNVIVTSPISGIGIISSFDCGIDPSTSQTIDLGEDISITDTFDCGTTI